MNRLRWVMDGSSIWEVDVSTPTTIDGVARPLAHDGPLPLGLSRGTRLSRPKQLQFFHKFMASPFVPCFSPFHGFSLQRSLTLPLSNDWFTSLLGSFDLQKFYTSVKNAHPSDSSLLQVIGRQLCDKSFYAFGFCSEFLVTSNDTLLVGYESREDIKAARKKAVFQHKFPNHNLILEAACPGLFIDKHGKYWDVPVSVAADVASVSWDSGASYHLSLQHISGSAKAVEGNDSGEVPTSLLPGLSLKSAFSFRKNFDLWRSQSKKQKLVQPFDVLLSNPHISASAVIGAVGTALLGDNASRPNVDVEPEGFRRFNLYASGHKSAILGDLFSTLSVTAQHGNFQRWFFDLSRIHLRLDVPSGSKFLSAAACVSQHLYDSKQPPIQAVQAVCPNVTLSLQQQLVGPFSLRFDSTVAVDLKNRDWKNVNLENPVFAIEYALQVLGSAKAIAWYAPKQKEFMVELRFFER
ncbi:hypothetical protein RND81_14G075900 [Saponaria officinalis]|uniref:Protein TRIGALACTOSYLDIACYLGLYCEROL 4, chloroplastic n=1 Tax=Saponaria officinalis TaxID=3572 RepID=A0AAW1GML9_SAPOF